MLGGETLGAVVASERLHIKVAHHVHLHVAFLFGRVNAFLLALSVLALENSIHRVVFISFNHSGRCLWHCLQKLL